MIFFRWALRLPIFNRGYKLVGLQAGAEYSNFEVRCRNLQGYSDWVSLVDDPAKRESISTEAGKPPSRPLFFKADRITSSCLHLTWMPPLFDGGQSIVNYRISYTIVRREKTVASGIKIIEKPNFVHTESAETRYAIHYVHYTLILFVIKLIIILCKTFQVIFRTIFFIY